MEKRSRPVLPLDVLLTGPSGEPGGLLLFILIYRYIKNACIPSNFVVQSNQAELALPNELRIASFKIRFGKYFVGLRSHNHHNQRGIGHD